MLSFLSRTGDTFYAFRFLRLLTTPWEKTGAFKLGIIDREGNVIRSPETSEEKAKFNMFHRLVFNLKRLLNKVPFGKTTLASYATALYLIKEETGISDRAIAEAMEKATGIKIDPIHESATWFLEEDGALRAGSYRLVRDVALVSSGAVVAMRGNQVVVKESTDPIGSIFGLPVFEAVHTKSRQKVAVTQADITIDRQ